MKKASLLLLISFYSLLHAQDIFKNLQDESEIIAHVIVDDITGTGDVNLGSTEVIIHASIKYAYKGSVSKDQSLVFSIISHNLKVDHTKNWERVKRYEEYIVFLQTIDWIIDPPKEEVHPGYMLTDRLLGIQPYYLDLHNQTETLRMK